MIVALVLGLVLGGGAVAALHIPNHSIGWNKLSKGVQAKLLQQAMPGPRGPEGPAGSPGATGTTGPQGVPGPANVVGYSKLMNPGEAEQTLAKVGPLTFTGSCAAEGEDTIKAVLSASSSANGVKLNGKPLNQGDTVTIQEVSVSGGGSDEEYLPIIRATDAAQTFALQGVPTIIVELEQGNCRFFGTLVSDG